MNSDDAYFNRNWAGACRVVGLDREGWWTGFEDAKLFMAGQDHCRSISQLRLEHLSAKTKKKEGSARAWPVAAPMPKSDYFSREKREMQNDGS